MNFLLCGMPGSGKSYFGALAAAELNYSFIDTDKCIEEKCQATCSLIVLKHGESYFRQIERQIISELQEVKNTIIALGGGALSSKAVISFLRDLGVLIYLKPSELKKPLPAFLKERTYAEVFNERHSIYEEACHVCVNEQNVLEVIRDYGK